MLISRNNKDFTTAVYHKPAFSGVYSNFNGFIAYEYKPGAYRESSKGGSKFGVKGHFLLIRLFSSVYSLNQKVS